MVIFRETPREEHRRISLWLRDQLNDDDFARAYQLVDRNHITLSARKILKEANREVMRPFRFLIGKN